MSSPFVLVVAIGIAFLASTLTVLAIREPLRLQLEALCAPGASATFWMRMAGAVLYLLPLFVVLVFGIPDPSREAVTAADIMRRCMAAAAFALTAIVVGMGLRLARRRPAMPAPRAIER